MKALSKADIAAWDRLTTDAQKEWDEVAAAHGKLADAIAEFNSTIEGLCALATEWADAAEGYVGERSEKWRESPRGEACTAWAEALRELAGQIEPVEEIELPEPPEWLEADLLVEPDL